MLPHDQTTDAASPEASTSLDALETESPHEIVPPRPYPAACGTDETPFDRGGWLRTHKRCYEAMVRLSLPPRRVEAYVECGKHPWVAVTKDDNPKTILVANRCRDRFCQTCGRRKALLIADNLRSHVEGKQLRFVTFTQKHTDQPLADQIDDLLHRFSLLRRRPVWSKTQVGGAVFLEVKLSRNDGRWHPHLHVLTQGKYVPIEPLRKAWSSVADGAHQVYVELVRDYDTCTRYVLKYVSKPFDAQVVFDDDRLDEAMHALASRHTAMTFGTWRGFQLCKQPDHPDLQWLMSFAELQRQKDEGQRYACELWNRLCLTYGRESAIVAVPPPQENDPRPPPPQATLFDTNWTY